jgi:hypothetical protein
VVDSHEGNEYVRAGMIWLVWHPCLSVLNLFQTPLTVDYSGYYDSSPVDAVDNSVTVRN